MWTLSVNDYIFSMSSNHSIGTDFSKRGLTMQMVLLEFLSAQSFPVIRSCTNSLSQTRQEHIGTIHIMVGFNLLSLNWRWPITRESILRWPSRRNRNTWSKWPVFRFVSQSFALKDHFHWQCIRVVMILMTVRSILSVVLISLDAHT